MLIFQDSSSLQYKDIAVLVVGITILPFNFSVLGINNQRWRLSGACWNTFMLIKSVTLVNWDS